VVLRRPILVPLSWLFNYFALPAFRRNQLSDVLHGSGL